MTKGIVAAICMLLAINGYSIDAYFNHSKLFSPDDGTYLETQMLFNAASVRYHASEKGFQASVELTYIFEKENAVANFSKTIVKSPYTADSANAIADFLDVQRFFLPPGSYDLSIKLRDLNNPKDSGEIQQKIIIAAPTKDAFFSDVIFIDTTIQNTSGKKSIYSRGGIDLIPRISGYNGPDRKKLTTYCELYQTDFHLGEQEDYIVIIDLLDAQSGEPIPQYRVMKRYKSAAAQPILQTWDISEMQTGNYIVRFEAKSRNNTTVAQQSASIQRHSFSTPLDSIADEALARTFVGQIKKEDSLRNMLYCMRYVGTHFEQKFIDENWKKGDTTELKRFFYGFWRERNAIDPETEWRKYHNEIKIVEREFSLGQRRNHACATDRGKVYLTYGKPNTRAIQSREPNASPYEIWHYYQVPARSNAKFVFYDRTLVTNNFVLLHSNVPGEPVDYQWFQRLSTPSVSPSGNDEPGTSQGSVVDINNLNNMRSDEVGSRALDLWNNPR